MENKRQVGASSSSYSLDHIFGPKDSSSSSSSSTGLFGSIFPTPPTVLGRDSYHYGNTGSLGNQKGNSKYASPDKTAHSNKAENSGITNKDKSSIYQNETAEPCYFSSSIYYGGQENYSPRTKTSESHNMVKKDGGEDDPSGNNSNSASRGNWWQGSLYY